MQHSNKPIVIIGSGLAGYNTAKELRKLLPDQAILVITREGGEFYPKPGLSSAFENGKSVEDLINQSAQEMAQKNNMEVLTHTIVREILPGEKKILYSPMSDSDVIDRTTEKIELSYHKLVLATGSDAKIIVPEGISKDQMLVVNNIDDYRLFRAKLKAKDSIVIVGGGLIGCEFANDLSSQDFQVSVVEYSPWLLARFVPEQIGQSLAQEFQKRNVQVFTNNTIQKAHFADNVFSVVLKSGEQLQVNHILAAIGVAPQIELAKIAGLNTDMGILVDKKMQTSHPDIYAVGDCAQYPAGILPYLAPLVQAAKILAKNLADQKEELTLPALPVIIKTSCMPVVTYPPANAQNGQWHISGNHPDWTATWINDQNLKTGFALSGQTVQQKKEFLAQMPDILT